MSDSMVHSKLLGKKLWLSTRVIMLVTKKNFAAVFREAFDQTVKVTTIVNLFRDSGIYPVNFSAIRASKLSSVFSRARLIKSHHH